MSDILAEQYPDSSLLTADGFDDCILGVDQQSMRVIYSADKCILKLAKDMTHEEAVEYFDFNVSGSYVGKHTPIWCYELEG